MSSSATSSKATSTVVAAGGAILVTAGLMLLLQHQRRNFVSEFYRRHRGMSGLLRYAWLGDHLPPQIRQSMNDLDHAEKLMVESEEELEQIEILIERARLESVDDGSTATAASSPAAGAAKDDESRKQSLFQQDPKLRTRIGLYSNTLDKLASSVDSVKSHSDEEVKRRKKTLSNNIVELMNELDRMISTFHWGFDTMIPNAFLGGRGDHIDRSDRTMTYIQLRCTQCAFIGLEDSSHQYG